MLFYFTERTVIHMFYIHRTGWRFIHPSTFEMHRPNGSGNYLLILFQSPAIVYCDEKPIHVKRSTAILYTKGECQNYSGFETDFINDWIHFDCDDDSDFVETLDLPKNTPFVCRDAHSLSSMIRALGEQNQTNTRYTDTLVDLGIRQMLLKLCESIQIMPAVPDHPYLAKMQQLRSDIYNAPYKRWSVPDMAKSINLSLSYFQHLYRTFFKTSVLSDITASKIGYAKYLLETNDFPINYISSLCGYENPEHFMRQFKKYTGFTPTQYRQRVHTISDRDVPYR